MVWDDETIRDLRNLWAQGLSTAEIGRRLSVSKNAIVGKAHRLELDARPSPIRRDVAKPDIERLPLNPRMAGPTLPPLASTAAPAVIAPAVSAPAVSAPVVGVQPLCPVPVISPLPGPVKPVVVEPKRPVRLPAPIQFRRSVPACCWPIGEPGSKAFRFCEDLSAHGKPYCDEHAKLAYVKIRDRKENAA